MIPVFEQLLFGSPLYLSLEIVSFSFYQKISSYVMAFGPGSLKSEHFVLIKKKLELELHQKSSFFFHSAEPSFGPLKF